MDSIKTINSDGVTYRGVNASFSLTS